MKESLLSLLRNQKSDLCTFRFATDQLAYLLAAEATTYLKEKSVTLRTPLASCQGKKIAQEIVLIPILRSGYALLPAFLHFFPSAKVGFLGMRRNEKTAKPYLYYENLPRLSPHQLLFLLDPMIATSGSAAMAIEKILEQGGKEENIHLCSIIGASSGVLSLKKKFSKISIQIIAIDKKLNAQKYIVPGLGDFGDRYFGTI